MDALAARAAVAPPCTRLARRAGAPHRCARARAITRAAAGSGFGQQSGGSGGNANAKNAKKVKGRPGPGFIEDQAKAQAAFERCGAARASGARALRSALSGRTRAAARAPPARCAVCG
jgi:hypothetical protein